MIINRRTLLSRQESIDGRLKHACTTGLAVRRREAKQRERERETIAEGSQWRRERRGNRLKPKEGTRDRNERTRVEENLYSLSFRLVSSPLSVVGNFLPPDEDQPGTSRCRSDPPRLGYLARERGAKSWETKAKQTEINCTGNAFRLQMIIRDPSGSACLRFSANRHACRSPVTPYTPSTR